MQKERNLIFTTFITQSNHIARMIVGNDRTSERQYDWERHQRDRLCRLGCNSWFDATNMLLYWFIKISVLPQIAMVFLSKY